MSILALYELIHERGLTMALRITPMIDGYTVRLQAGRYDGPSPRYEKHFPLGRPTLEALDRMTDNQLSFF